MKILCEYCNSYISDTDEKCPYCGAVNEHLKRIGDGVPKTIDDLKLWYTEKNLPDENITRFFIGKDIKEARAFGIYFDDNTGNYVVYKNKSDGSRAVRYSGKDEEYAVNELYIKLKEEIINQKKNNISNYSHSNNNTNITLPYHSSGLFSKIAIIFIFILVFQFLFFIVCFYVGSNLSRNEGYYNYDGIYYYYNDTKWFRAGSIENNEWVYAGDYDNKDELPKKLLNKPKKYFISSINIENDSIPDSLNFEKSGFYFDNCSEGYYTLDNVNIYYYYNSYWHGYLKNYFGNGQWLKYGIDELNTVSKDIRCDCNRYYVSTIDSNWGILDFRQSSYYNPPTGYYKYNGKYYYYYSNEWYKYDNGWMVAGVPPVSNYYDYSSYNDGDVSDFTSSSYYHSSSSYYDDDYDYDYDYDDDDWDSSSSWDSGDSWDSGSTDWDSDW